MGEMLKVHQPHNVVGYYKIGGTGEQADFAFAFTKKPWWIHRILMRWLMGFKWEDR